MLIRGTAVLAVAGYAGRIAVDVAGQQDERGRRRARSAVDDGAVFLWLHVAAAFHFVHAWSHAAAWEHTRTRTLEMTGWNSGVGLAINDTLMALWLADVVGWWSRLDWPQRHRAWFWTVQAFFAFMMFNATAVFGPWYWTPVVVATLGALVVQHIVRRRCSLGA